MTNENIIKQLKRLIPSLQYADDVNAVKGAIQALSQEQISLNDINNALGASFRNGVRSAKVEQEPCDDAIDREYLFKVLDDFCGHDRTETITLDTLADIVYELPSVTQKSGHWIEHEHLYKCSVCGEISCCHGRFCNECGAKMVEPQESEG